MTSSMTAFALARRSTALGELQCELRSVNHRYLEQSLRLPDELRAFESAIREEVAKRLARGKVDITMRLRAEAGDTADLTLNQALLDQLALSAFELHNRFPGLVRLDFTDLLRYPGVLGQPTVDADSLRADTLAALDATLDEHLAARVREGDKLADVLRQRLDAVAAIVTALRGMMPEIRAALRLRLETRLAELKQPLDPGRLEQEVVLQVTKSDVDEELDRLDTHIAEARRVLALDEPVGRRLDFLMQEFNREANTLGSKAVDVRSTNAAVELKVLIEQMREQVQNIE